MMLFGTKEKHVSTFKIDTKCRACETKDTIYMNVYQKYTHLLGIPIFPTSKVPVTECRECKKVTEKEKFSNNMYHVFLKLKKKAKTPVWTYSGVAVILVAISFSLGNYIIKSKRAVDFILQPKAGDVYQMRMDEQKFLLAKVHLIKGDSTYLLFHHQSTSEASQLEKLSKYEEKAFNSSILSYAKHS